MQHEWRYADVNIWSTPRNSSSFAFWQHQDPALGQHQVSTSLCQTPGPGINSGQSPRAFQVIPIEVVSRVPSGCEAEGSCGWYDSKVVPCHRVAEHLLVISKLLGSRDARCLPQPRDGSAICVLVFFPWQNQGQMISGAGAISLRVLRQSSRYT